MSGIRVNEWLHNSGTGGIWQTSAGNVGIASSVPTAKLVVTGDANVSGAVTATDFSGSLIGNRNLVINGAFNVAQRGTSSTSSQYQTVDRFKYGGNSNDETPTQAQHALTSSDTGPWEKGFRYSYHVTNGNQTSGAGAADIVYLYHFIEAQDIASSGWDYTNSTSKLTLSFWVKSSVAQNFYGFIKTMDGTAQLLTFETTALTADTWKYVTVSIPGHANLQFDNDAEAGLQLAWMPFFGTDYTTSGKTLNAWAAYSGSDRSPDNTSTWYTTNDATWEITGVQLEVGNVATAFEHLRYGDELANCQRYYWRTSADNNVFFPGLGMADVDGNTVILNTQFPVRMRSAPSALEQTGTASDYKIRRSTTQTCSSVPTFGNATTDQVSTNFIKSSHGWGDGSTVRAMGGTSGAYLGWSAELS